MKTTTWYKKLIKPSWAPPSWIFGPVWTILYIIIAVSFSAVGYSYFNSLIPPMVALPFLLNLIFNFSFSSIQFRLQNNYLAALDILLVLVTLIWALVAIYPYSSWITLVNLPYLAWVSFATILQLSITYLNR